MSEISRWLERKFTFDLPVELYPNILIRLRGTPGRLEQLTHGLQREILTAKPMENGQSRRMGATC